MVQLRSIDSSYRMDLYWFSRWTCCDYLCYCLSLQAASGEYDQYEEEQS